MILLIDIFSINKGQGYENPSLEIIVAKRCSIGGCPLEEACEHCFLNQSVIFVVVLISFMCYCGDYARYITVILPFLEFYLCSAYLLYLVSCNNLLLGCNWTYSMIAVVSFIFRNLCFPRVGKIMMINQLSFAYASPNESIGSSIPVIDNY
jgi:hypothetical protein